MKKSIEIFNKYYGTSYSFTHIDEFLAYAPTPELGDMKLVVKEAGLYVYRSPKLEGDIFEMVFKLTGGHFTTAIIGRSINNTFEPFSLQAFPDEVSVLPDEVLDRLNNDITNAARIQ